MSSGYKARISSVLKCVDMVLFGAMFTLRRANKILQQKIDSCEEVQFKDDRRLDCEKGDIKEEFVASINRLEKIENKAMHTLLGLAVAIALFGATSGILGSDGMVAGKGCAIRIASASLLILAMFYFLASGILALRAYQIGKVYRPQLSDRTPIVTEKQEKISLLYCIEQNHQSATMRSNRLSAAFSCLRNGIVIIFVLGVLIVVAGVLL